MRANLRKSTRSPLKRSRTIAEAQMCRPNHHRGVLAAFTSPHRRIDWHPPGHTPVTCRVRIFRASRRCASSATPR